MNIAPTSRLTITQQLIEIARRPMTYWQRLSVAVFYAAVALWVVHPWLSMQLVISANDALVSGNPDYARHLYDRALFVDPLNRFAAEGWMMATTELHSPHSKALAIHFADHYLARDPDAIEVRRQRAVAEWHSGMKLAAARDFLIVAQERETDTDWQFAESSGRFVHDAEIDRALRAHVAATGARS